ncbi:MAG: S-layer homology domain-containing protein, partial [Bifidobacteriaceae bacterium]|nr:S-layer homology domain-containing protein [Bifidobacteriaceae bacterium]
QANAEEKATVTIKHNNLNRIKSDFRFLDVPLSPTARDSIVWAYQYGVVNGYSASSYKPGNKVTRAAMAIYLYNVAGKPAFTPGKNPFKDINSKTTGYKEIMWLVQNKITTGTSSTKYSPSGSVTRNQMASFLYREAGSPSYSQTSCGFKDVSNLTTSAKKSICYIKSKGVTTGTTSSTYSPKTATNRNQMTTFIYREAKNILGNIVEKIDEPDILLGAFFTNQDDPFNVNLYTSVDGISFQDPMTVSPTSSSSDSLQSGPESQNNEDSGYKIFTPRQEEKLKSILSESDAKQKQLESENSNIEERLKSSNLSAQAVSNFRDPSISYFGGYFWVIGTLGVSQNATGFWVTYSEDLRTFSDPQKIDYIGAPNNIPKFSGGWIDSWAPSFYVEGSNIYIIISVGASNNYLTQAITKCTTFQGNKVEGRLVDATISCNSATTMNFSGATANATSNCDINKNYKGKIDGHIRKIGSTYYLTDKPNGHCPNEIFSSSNVNGTYRRVNNNIVDSNKYGTHANNGADIYKTLEGNTSIFYRNKYFAYPDNFYPSGASYNGNVQYIISGSEQFNADTRPVQAIAPRRLRHGQVENFKNENAKEYIWELRNGVPPSTVQQTMITIQPETTRPDSKFVQNQTGYADIYITNKNPSEITKSVKFWDTKGNSKIVNNIKIPGKQTSRTRINLSYSSTGSFTGYACLWNTSSSTCDSNIRPSFSTSIISNSNQNLATLGAVWADQTGNGTIRVTIAHPATDGGWPITQYKVELERYKKSALVKYVGPGTEYVYFNNLAKGMDYWVKLTAISGFGSSPRHVRSCGYNSKANCDSPVYIK